MIRTYSEPHKLQNLLTQLEKHPMQTKTAKHLQPINQYKDREREREQNTSLIATSSPVCTLTPTQLKQKTLYPTKKSENNSKLKKIRSYYETQS